MRENNFKPGDLATFDEDSDFGKSARNLTKVCVIIEDITDDIYNSEYLPPGIRAYQAMVDERVIVIYSHEIHLVEG